MSTNRLYSGSDADMTEAARLIHNLLAQDLATFAAYNTAYTSNYLAEYLAKIEAAEQVQTDATAETQQAIASEPVYTAFQNAKTLTTQIQKAAHQAYKHRSQSPAKYKLFTKGLRQAKRKQTEMIRFLETLRQNLADNLTDMTNPNLGGLPTDLPTRLETAYQNMLSSNANQEVAKRNRSVLTEDRISTLNAAYTEMTAINNMAQGVYASSPAHRSRYVFRPSSSTTDVEVYTGSLTPGTVSVIATLSYEATKYLSFENLGTNTLEFDLATTNTPVTEDAITDNYVDLASGAILNHPMGWLLDNVEDGIQVNLIAACPAEAQSNGAYKVTVNLD